MEGNYMIPVYNSVSVEDKFLNTADAIMDIDPVFLEEDPNVAVEQNEDDKELKVAFNKFAKPARLQASLEMIEEQLVVLLTSFIRINHAPSDEQIHALAKSLGLAKEAVEQVIYQMLSESVGLDADLDTDEDMEDLDLDEDDDGEADEPSDSYDEDDEELDSEDEASEEDEEDSEDEDDEEDSDADSEYDKAIEDRLGKVTSAKPPFDEDHGYYEQGDGNDSTRSVITDPIDTDEKMANDGSPDEHVVKIKQAEAQKKRRSIETLSIE
jgi:hypothetical protein